MDYQRLLSYIFFMLVTVEVIKKETLNLLQAMESAGFIRLRNAASQGAPAPENKSTNRWLRGCCKNLPQGSVEEFLKRCRTDKELELAIEKHREEERSNSA